MKKLNCNTGNYQCGGKCQSNKNKCFNKSNPIVNKMTNRFESIIDKLSREINSQKKDKISQEIDREISNIIDKFNNKNKDKISEKVDNSFNEKAPEKLKPIIEDARKRMNTFPESDMADIASRFKGDKINEDALPMLSAYTRSDYREINDTLRGKKPQKVDFVPGKGIQDIDYSDEEMRIVQEKIEAMEYSYNQLKPLEKDTELYRGSNIPEELLSTITEGGEWSDDGYSSTSTNQEVSKRFAKNVFFIYNIKKGSENVKDLGKINQLGEEERIIRPQTKFKIKKIEEQNGIKVVYLEE